MRETPEPFMWTLPRFWRGVKSALKFFGHATTDDDEHFLLFVLFLAMCTALACVGLLVLLTKGWALIIAFAFVLAFDLLRLIGRGVA